MIKEHRRKLLVLFAILFLALFVAAFWWVRYLQVAHSSFENYYEFRGCVSLVERTDDYGICKLASGETLKIVKYQDRWFLNGDLPVDNFF